MNPTAHQPSEGGTASRLFPLATPRASRWRSLMVPALLLLLITGLLGGYGYLQQQEAQLLRELPLQGAQLQAAIVEECRHLYSSEVVERLRSHGIQSIRDYEGRADAIPLPATLTIELGRRLNQARPGAHIRLYSDYPFPWRQPGGPRDEFERQALQALRQHPEQPFYRFEDFEGRPSLRYALADRMKASCVACHNQHRASPKTNWQEGDVRGVLEVIRPLDDNVAASFATRRRGLILWETIAGLGLLGLCGLEVRRQRSARALAASEQRMQDVLEYSADAIVAINQTGRIEYVNDRAETLFGYRRDELFGKEVECLMPERFHARHREHIARFMQESQSRAVSVGMTQHGRRKDGDEVLLEISLNPARAAGKNLVFAFIRDITEREQLNEYLRQINNENTMLLGSIQSILIRLDGANRVVLWNEVAARSLAVKAAQVLGQPLEEAGIPWDGKVLAQSLATCRANKSVVRLDSLMLQRPDGSARHLAMTLTPLVDGNLAVPGVLIMGADVTERQQLLVQLAHAQKLESIGQLAAGVAHEINTPVQYIGDNLNFLQESFAALCKVLPHQKPLIEACQAHGVAVEQAARAETEYAQAEVEFLIDEIPRALEQSQEGVHSVARIVRAMKEFSHPGGEELTAVDLNRAIENTITVARNEWKYHAEVVSELDPDLPPIPCLAGKFNQVILNLIINAAHAIGDRVAAGELERGKITVCTKRLAEQAQISIGDNGGGIPEGVRARIFDPFFTTKPVGKGTGQGLTIAYNVVVKKHHGHITFETEVGRGTTFHIFLPLENTLENGERV